MHESNANLKRLDGNWRPWAEPNSAGGDVLLDTSYGVESSDGWSWTDCINRGRLNLWLLREEVRISLRGTG